VFAILLSDIDQEPVRRLRTGAGLFAIYEELDCLRVIAFKYFSHELDFTKYRHASVGANQCDIQL
jgi:hypothetical protein